MTYRQRQPSRRHLTDLLNAEPSADRNGVLWLVSWGFDIPKLLRRLRGRCVAYHAHSSGYSFDLPPGIPVLAVSRNTLGYWGNRAPHNPLFLVPNALDSQWLQRGARYRGPSPLGKNITLNPRPIDVLVQARKSSSYVLYELVPSLRAEGLKVTIQYGWVSDLVELFNNSTVFIYDSAEYWHSCGGISEGFGLTPLEALACGCIVFSSLNHALADTIDPGFVGHQIGCGTLGWDQQRIVAAVSNPEAWTVSSPNLEALLRQHSETAVLPRWRQVLVALHRIDQQLVASSEYPLRCRKSPLLRLKQLWQRRFLSYWVKHLRCY